MRPGGLGRGLSALIPAEASARVRNGTVRAAAELLEIPVSSIMANPNQPRVHFDEEALSSLSASISELGVLQPILVRVAPEGAPSEYELVAGERRWRAARRAGLQTIPAVIRHTGDQASVEQALVENLHREDLNALEEAAAYQQLLGEYSLTHEALAQRVGKSRVSITNSLRLFQLTPTLQKYVREGKLSAGHGRAILVNPDRIQQERLAEEIIAQGLSVRAAETLARQSVAKPKDESTAITSPVVEGSPTMPIDLTTPEAKEVAPRATRDPGLIEVEELLSEALSTRVNIDMSTSHGRIVIDVADVADLERVYRIITANTPAL